MKMKSLKESVKRLLKDVKAYGLAAVVFLGYYIIVHLMRASFCPMIHLTGLPCAGCGLTRAFLFIATGQWERAAYINPMAFLVILFALYCAYFRYYKGTKIKGFSVMFVLLISIVLIFYAVRMYLFFPDRVPYVYTRDNVFAGRIPGYEDAVYRLIRFLREFRK